MTHSNKIILFTILFFTVLMSVFVFIAPWPQEQGYHSFADERSWFIYQRFANQPSLVIHNWMNVLSNAVFLLAGSVGLATILFGKMKDGFHESWHKWSFTTYFAAVIAIAFGSGYYHFTPSDASLFWDRLPMTVAFTGFFVAVIADRMQLQKHTVSWLLPVGVLSGIASLFIWIYFNDLRFYGFIQFAPKVMILLACVMFRKSLYTHGKYLGWMVAWYVLAKITEHYDLEIFELTERVISGHTLKHIFAGVATYVPIRMLLAHHIKK